MYPATIFNWHDNSEINTQIPMEPVADNAPLLMQVFAADKGTEDFIEISGQDFNRMYGIMNFDKYGQAAIQAQAIINAGGRLFAKRVVAANATIANLVMVATVEKGDDGITSIAWSIDKISGAKSFDEVKTAAAALLDDANGKYPLFVFSDNGRGVSNKAVRITPDYNTSKTIGKIFYNLSIYEGTSITEQKTITVDPTVIYSSESYRLDRYSTTQVTGEVMPDVYELFLAKVATETGFAADDLRKNDLVFGKTYKGGSITNTAGVAVIKVNTDSMDPNADLGNKLDEGTNGAFGNGSVIGNADYEKALAAAFGIPDGSVYSSDDVIYDVDQHKVAAIVDANYPRLVKKAIFDLVTFREDCVYLRDFGLGLDNFTKIKEAYDQFSGLIAPYESVERNRYVADYCTSYIIVDPTSKKNIEVTMTYDMAINLVDHLKNNFNAPLAGFANNFILRNAIKGSVSYIPVKTPSVNQKEAMDELRVNYAIFEGDNCVVQSEYSSQDAYTQLSYINNVMAIQTVMRAVRNECPRQRFSLSTDGDLESYASAVNEVLSLFNSSFDVLRFTYTQDPLRARQKIFYASIEFALLNWAQTEIFDIYAINN